MSIPKSFLDVMGKLAVGQAGDPFVSRTQLAGAAAPTEVSVGPAIAIRIRSDGGDVKLGISTAATSPYATLADGVSVEYANRFDVDSAIYAHVDPANSGAYVEVLGWRPAAIG